MPDKKGVMSCFVRSYSKPGLHREVVLKPERYEKSYNEFDLAGGFRWSVRAIKISVNCRFYSNL